MTPRDEDPLTDDFGTPLRPPAGRYGPERKGAGPLAITAWGIVAALFVSVIVAIGWDLSRPEVTSELRAYDVVDDDTVEVTYLVRRSDPEAQVDCVIRARDRESREVGRQVVTVPPGNEVVVTTILSTTGRAILGEVQACRVVP